MTAVETRMDGPTFVMTMNRPESMNAMNTEMRDEFAAAWAEVRDNPDIRSVVITGAGDRAFSAGADLKEIAQMNASGGGPPRNVFWDQQPPTLIRGLEMWKPVIAAVNGFALGGGCELAMSCDIRVACDEASFGLPEVARGIIPGAGGTQRMPRLVPFGIALELLMTGRRISADEAQRIGLVNHVVSRDQLMDKAMEIAAEIGANAPLAVMAVKEAAFRGLNTTLQEGLRIENFESQAIRHTADAKEGPKAFAEKRAPNYQGR